MLSYQRAEILTTEKAGGRNSWQRQGSEGGKANGGNSKNDPQRARTKRPDARVEKPEVPAPDGTTLRRPVLPVGTRMVMAATMEAASR